MSLCLCTVLVSSRMFSVFQEGLVRQVNDLQALLGDEWAWVRAQFNPFGCIRLKIVTPDWRWKRRWSPGWRVQPHLL